MAIINSNMERFEVIGRGFLNIALHPLNLQPPNGSLSQPQTSNPRKSYGQGPNVTQPPMAFVPSQAPEPDPNYFNYSALEFLATDAS